MASSEKLNTSNTSKQYLMEHISVIFTHWGQSKVREELAIKSLSSLLESTGIPLEIIVVHNKGEVYFEFREICLALLNRKLIAHYIENAENLHFGYARNQGILMATA